MLLTLISSSLWALYHRPAEECPAGGSVGGNGDCGGGLGGWAGATPHSGKPFGRWIRFGSQSSSLVALSFYNNDKQPTKKKMLNAFDQELYPPPIPPQKRQRDERRAKRDKTDKVFLSHIKFLSIPIET